MGELATAVDDLPRYVKDGHGLVTAGMTARLDGLVGEIEAAKVSAKGWALPGANAGSAALDVARTVCRRAERRVCSLQEADQLQNTRNTGLSEPAVRPALALRKVGGDKAGVSPGPRMINWLSSQRDTRGTFRPHDAVRT